MEPSHSTTFCLVWLFLVKGIFAAPAFSKFPTRNIKRVGNLLLPLDKPSIPLDRNFNYEPGYIYNVPGTLTSLEVYLGFPINATSMRYTIGAIRQYTIRQVEAGSRGPLPWDEDPFIEDRGWGAAIRIFSAQPNQRLTWRALKEAAQGLWEFLILQGRFVEAEFNIMDGSWKIVGRGVIESAPIH